MKKSTFHIIRALCAGCLMPAAGAAQNAVGVDFETDASYRAVGVYDTWENSPFRTGLLQGNAKVVSNPRPEVDADLALRPTPRGACWRCSVHAGAATRLVRALTCPVRLS